MRFVYFVVSPKPKINVIKVMTKGRDGGWWKAVIDTEISQRQ